MLLVSGMDTVIVGAFDFKDVGAFGVSINIVAFFIGLFRAILSPLLQVFVRQHARQNTENLMEMLEFTSYVTTLLLLVVSCWMVLPAPLLIRLWVGAKMAAVSVPTFAILMFANVIRNSAAPYAHYLLAVGWQKRAYSIPLP